MSVKIHFFISNKPMSFSVIHLKYYFFFANHRIVACIYWIHDFVVQLYLLSCILRYRDIKIFSLWFRKMDRQKLGNVSDTVFPSDTTWVAFSPTNQSKRHILFINTLVERLQIIFLTLFEKMDKISVFLVWGNIYT